MKKYIIPLCLSFMSLVLNAQGPYKFNHKTDDILITTMAALTITDLLVAMNVKELNQDEVNRLNSTDIFSLDRNTVYNFSEAADLRSDIGAITPVVFSALSTCIVPKFKNNSQYKSEAATLMLLWFETNMLTYLTTDICKSTVLRLRPYAYNYNVPLEDKLIADTRKSFFSGHTSMSAANSFFAAKIFSDYYPNSKWKPLIWSFAFAIPAWTGLERYNAGMHFPTDVITGYLFGATCGYFVPQIHKISNADISKLSFMPFTNSYGSGLSLHYTF